MAKYAEKFTEETLAALFPAERTDQFFEALFGDAEEGSYDIALRYRDDDGEAIDFELELIQRPGRCLACNLTYGLPTVFSRHPIIDLAGLAERLAAVVGRAAGSWSVGATHEVNRTTHAIPLVIELA
ncbi:pancreas/duodenum homeobox protein 1 [Pseudodesulfovibrio sp.]|uniref:pancreas/duodenum homeobox protein 1 n=1 Tax=Pseudodesulfovibrio sp. TaxID=2035812 RepID=UPI002636B37F|nr:pancreas/duodenum homeobox protein 1 [Pseudodesulfovibrio sp.]MDD3311877.1 pancreas/duodenum homeobox protein 1 [Pseudodesulfovibrio sp.]